MAGKWELTRSLANMDGMALCSTPTDAYMALEMDDMRLAIAIFLFAQLRVTKRLHSTARRRSTEHANTALDDSEASPQDASLEANMATRPQTKKQQYYRAFLAGEFQESDSIIAEIASESSIDDARSIFVTCFNRLVKAATYMKENDQFGVFDSDNATNAGVAGQTAGEELGNSQQQSLNDVPMASTGGRVVEGIH
jgi:hypothetical protein